MATIGIDLGGTKVFGAVVDGGKVKSHAKKPTPATGPAGVVDAIASVIGELDTDKVTKVGVGAPGQIDFEGGVVVEAPNLVGWDEPVPLGALLSDALDGAEVRIDNDVNVGTLGEHRYGAGRDFDNVLGVFVGTGVGGGVVLGGELRRGPHGLAGEIGHIIVHPDGRPWGDGALGTLEAYAGRGSMEDEARRRHADGEPSALIDIAGEDRMKSSVFAKALDAGDQMANELIDEAVEALGIAIATATLLVDLDAAVIGGGLGDRLGATFAGRVEQAARSRLFGSSSLRVVPSALGDDSGAIGAALLFDR